MSPHQSVQPVATDPCTQLAVHFLGALVWMRARGSDTNNAFALLEHSGNRGYMSPLHLHEGDDETFLVLDGTLRVEVGPERLTAGPGSLVLLPRAVPHGFVVTSPTARFLTFHTPSGFDDFVAQIGSPAGDPHAAPVGPGLDPEELTRIGATYGIRIVGPPLQPDDQ
jgi:quercetin dioxygenase-like cupin family protein